MAIVYVMQYGHIGKANSGDNAQVAQLPADTVTVVTLSASSQQVSIGRDTRLVELKADGGSAHFLYGTNPTATTSYNKITDQERVTYGVPGGGKLALIQGT